MDWLLPVTPNQLGSEDTEARRYPRAFMCAGPGSVLGPPAGTPSTVSSPLDRRRSPRWTRPVQGPATHLDPQHGRADTLPGHCLDQLARPQAIREAGAAVGNWSGGTDGDPCCCRYAKARAGCRAHSPLAGR
jgi:hypothetical protein